MKKSLCSICPHCGKPINPAQMLGRRNIEVNGKPTKKFMREISKKGVLKRAENKLKRLSTVL